MKKKLLGYYNYTVILTYLGMILSLAGICFIIQGQFLICCIFLMLSGCCDMFDGVIASTRKRTDSEKCFGIQIDSMCDLISFGVLPGLFVYCLLGHSLPGCIIGALFVLCALIRLSFFNVLEAERQKETDGHRTSYLGLPVTSIALLLPLAYALYAEGVYRTLWVFPILLAVVAAAFLIPFRVKKPGSVGKIIMIVIGAAEFALLLLAVKGGAL